MNAILRKYQKTHGDLKKDVLTMRFEEHPELYDSKFLNEKEHKEFQHIIGVCQWIIFVGIFDLSYSVYSLSGFLDATQLGHIDMDRRTFGYLKKYLEIGYAINPQPMTIDANYEKVHMKYYFGNQYAYLRKEIYDQFPEPLLDELDIHVFVDADHGHVKVTGILITGLFSVVISTPTTCSSKIQTAVQTSTFGYEFTSLKNAVKGTVIIWYHLKSMRIKLFKPTPVFSENTSLVLNATNPGSTLNKKPWRIANILLGNMLLTMLWR